jgi:hypothetical protein
MAAKDKQRIAEAAQERRRVNPARTVKVEKGLKVNGIPLFAPVFQEVGAAVRIEAGIARGVGDVVFAGGGNLRNTLLDFSESGVNAFAFTEVLDKDGDVLCNAGLTLNDKDPRIFVDKDWVVSTVSAGLREIDEGAPFATVFIVCQREKPSPKGVSNVTVSINGQTATTDANGWAKLELANIGDRVLPLIAAWSSSGKQQWSGYHISVPVVSTSPGMMFYRQFTVDLP